MTDEKMWPPPSAPLDVADRFIKEVHTTAQGKTLTHHRGDFYAWHAGVWSVVPQSSIRASLYDTLRSAKFEHKKDGIVDWAPSTRKVGDVLDAMRSAVYLREDRDAPTWITPGDRHPAREYISMRNGLLHIPTGEIIAHTPAMFNTISIPFDYDAAAQAPNWLRFLGSVWRHDTATITMLQQWFGYVLSGRTDFQKAMMIPGPPRSGKGTIVRVLIELLGGRRHVAAPTMADIGTHFGITPIIGKPLAVIGDARVGRGGERQVVERLLTITGEDNLTVDVKYKEAWTGKIGARFMILSNELPRFGDASGAIASRFLVARTTQSFLGKEDKGLEARLHAELPGIFNWALAGLESLIAAGRFTESDGSKAERDALTALASPISMFLDEGFEPDMTGWMSTDMLYGKWRAWCEVAGESPGSRNVFARDLVAAAPMQGYRLQAAKSGPRGAQKTGYRGIRQRGEEPSKALTIEKNPDTPDTPSSDGISEQLPILDTASHAAAVDPVVAGVADATEIPSEQRVSGVSGVNPIVSPLENASENETPPARALHAVPDEHPGPPRTCREWFERHVRGLIAEGHMTADSAVVYPLGEAAGWGIQNLRKVASKSPLIAIAEKRTDGVTWAIGDGVQSTYVPCPEWIVTYLRERGGWVPASEVYTAGSERYGRSAIKSAALAAHILKRGASIATEWSLDPNYTKESA
ncbi:hypothetical protein FK268_05190 [Tsukamurella sputi]|uniref:SF3 helicase domain-containing protein n=1 Tax=Tsukamurella sputi TaxID=2591848 RepID=A0A5C5RUA8_9ACTN|nr:phage/plasmid primase, P4 family [Tsukamurella sputi]TWS26617.1 hypothetical protein FK268_05190 [Tsukamurella sputi]